MSMCLCLDRADARNRMTKEKGYYDEEAIKLRTDVKTLEEKEANGQEVESWTMKNAVRARRF